MESNNKRIVKNTFLLYGRMIVVLCVSLYTTRIVLKNLGVIDYGTYNVVAGFVSMFAFLNTSLINTIQRYLNVEKGRGSLDGINEVFRTSIIIQALLALILFVLLELFGTWYINHVMVVPENRLFATNVVYQCSIFSLILLVLQIPYSSAVVSYERMDFFAVVSIFDAIFKLVIVFLLPYLGHDSLIVYGFLMLGLSVINYALYFGYIRAKIPNLKFHFIIDKSRFKSMLSFSGWNVFESVAYTAQGQGINMIINSFFGTVVNASRGVAFQSQSAIYSFSVNIGTAFRPQLTEACAREDYNRTNFLFYSMSKMCFFMQMVLSLPIIFEMDKVLRIWLGDNIPEYSKVFTILVLVNSIVGSINLPISQVVQATGNIKKYQIFRSILVFLTLPISYLCLYLCPLPELVFYVTLLVTIILQPLSIFLLSRVYVFSIKDYLQKVIIPIILFTAILLFCLYQITVMLPNLSYRFVVTGLVDLTVGLLGGYILLLTNDEREMVKHFIRSKIKK
jgi:O-antigen/teichoic acid export membrane protein